MALERSVKDIQDQTAQLQEMFLNLSLGQEEMKALLTKGLGSSNNARSDQIAELQFDLTTLRTQMMGQLVGQMALIQDLSQRQEELRVLVRQLLPNNQLGQTSEVEEQVTAQPPSTQEDKGKAPLLASGSQAHQQPRQRQRGNRRKQETSGRQFTETEIPSFFILKRLLEVNLLTVKDPPQKLNISSPRFNPDEFCVYHSCSPGHSTNDCWALKNKIQDLIDIGVLEFMPDGEMKIFR